MTLEQLRIFLAVAEREHVTRAAEALHLTQSTVSAAIASLEERLGLALFDRVGRGIRLTDAGRVMREEARSVLARLSQAEAAMAGLRGLARGRIQIAASQTVGTYWLPVLLHRFHGLYPGIALDLSIANSATVARRVEEGQADIGLVEDTIPSAALAADPVAEDELVLVMSPKAAAQAGIAPGQPVAAGDLLRLGFISRETGSGTRAMFERALPPLGLRPDALRVVLELPSNEAVRIAAEDGAGAAVLSRQVVAGALRAGTLVAMGLDLPKRDFTLLRHRERTLSPAAQAFSDMLRGTRVLPGAPRRSGQLV